MNNIDIDPAVRPLVDALNTLPGISTYSSCGGHENHRPGQHAKGHFYVCFNVEEGPMGRPLAMAWDSIALITRAAGATRATVTMYYDGGINFELDGETWAIGPIAYMITGADECDIDLDDEVVE